MQLASQAVETMLCARSATWHPSRLLSRLTLLPPLANSSCSAPSALWRMGRVCGSLHVGGWPGRSSSQCCPACCMPCSAALGEECASRSLEKALDQVLGVSRRLHWVVQVVVSEVEGGGVRVVLLLFLLVPILPASFF